MGNERTEGGESDGTHRLSETDVDIDALRSELGEHPVRLAVLFGSRVTGRTDRRSDVDLLVEFDETVDNTVTAYQSLLADLSIVLERNDIDLSLVPDIDPRVGRQALDEGLCLVGSTERMRVLQTEFESREPAEPTKEQLRERFDDALSNVDKALDGEA